MEKKEFNFKITTQETGWVAVEAYTEEDAIELLRLRYPDQVDLLDERKWVEGGVTQVLLQKDDADNLVINW